MFSSNTSAANGAANYIEDVFSTYLYTGNGSTQTITNGIDLSTKGGLVWSKSRSNIENNVLLDTIRGPNNILTSNSTAAGSTSGTPYVTATTTGYSIGTSNSQINASSTNYASWTFRKQPKFFDVVTYTGNGSSPRDIAHSLGSVPGCIFLKRTDSTDNWIVYHRSIDVTNTGGANTIFLNLTAAAEGPYNYFGYTVPTSTTFKVGSNANINGATYVAYLFAHDAGGFGLTGTDNVISCGSYTGDGGTGTTSISLGYEPQFILSKRTDAAGNWSVLDIMRGLSLGAGDANLQPNTSNAEGAPADYFDLTATGFKTTTSSNQNVSGANYIYIAIRRGPMKVPTDATKVFSPVARAGTSTATSVTTNFPVDFIISKGRNPSVGLGENWGEFDRLRGLAVLSSNNTGVEFTSPTYQLGIANFANNTGMNLSASDNDYGYINKSGYNYGTYFFQRAPSFFDVVCYTGTGSARTVTHNLGVAPELIIIKKRSSATNGNWAVYSADRGNTSVIFLNLTNAIATSQTTYWNSTSPTSTVFTVGTNANLNSSSDTFVAYLFATCAGVQYINSYVGDGTTGRTINCGFTSGARFVCIKATSTTGSWWTFDSARGIVTNNDPALQLNSTAAEVTSADAIDTASSGFIVNQEATCSLNASGVTYLVWAIA